MFLIIIFCDSKQVTLECRSDTMLVSIDTTETFSGLVYTEVREISGDSVCCDAVKS